LVPKKNLQEYNKSSVIFIEKNTMKLRGLPDFFAKSYPHATHFALHATYFALQGLKRGSKGLLSQAGFVFVDDLPE